MSRAGEGYFRRAEECFAFAETARDAEERAQLLVMANNLLRIAIDRQGAVVQPTRERRVTKVP